MSAMSSPKGLMCLFCFGPQGIQFYTQVKTVTQMWRGEDATPTKASTNMPVQQ